MRALIVTNMYPTPERPALGSFVRDQVEALRRIDDVELDVFAFAPGGVRRLRTRRARALDAGSAASGSTSCTPTSGCRSGRRCAVRRAARAVTLHGTDLEPSPLAGDHARRAALDGPRRAVSEALAQRIPRWAVRQARGRCCPAASTSAASGRIDRARSARARSGSIPTGRYLLFPADPARPEKRFDRAQSLVAGETRHAADARRRRPGRGARCGSTPPTRSSSRPSARVSAWPRSRRWRATCRCSRRRSASPPRRWRASPARSARRSTRHVWREALALYCDPIRGSRTADAERTPRPDGRECPTWRSRSCSSGYRAPDTGGLESSCRRERVRAPRPTATSQDPRPGGLVERSQRRPALRASFGRREDRVDARDRHRSRPQPIRELREAGIGGACGRCGAVRERRSLLFLGVPTR